MRKLAQELNVCRRDDPLSVLRELTAALRDAFDYAPQSTEGDSPIDLALKERARRLSGLCAYHDCNGARALSDYEQLQQRLKQLQQQQQLPSRRDIFTCPL